VTSLSRARAITSDRVFWAIAAYALSFMIFPVSDALAKRLAVRYPIAEIGAIRYGVHFLIVCGTALFWQGKTALRTTRRASHLLRGALMASTTLCIFAALRTTALANVAIILFVTPLVVVALSGTILRETVRAEQWVAVGIGFAGVLLVMQPTSEGIGWGMVLAVTAAICSALYQLVSRRLATTERPLVGLFYVTLVGTTVLGTLAMPEWQNPLAADWALMVLMGVIAAAGYFGIFKSIELASPAQLAPFFYLQIITAVALGYEMFGDVPDAWALVGMVIIVAAGLVCVALQQARRRASMPPLRID